MFKELCDLLLRLSKGFTACCLNVSPFHVRVYNAGEDGLEFSKECRLEFFVCEFRTIHVVLEDSQAFTEETQSEFQSDFFRRRRRRSRCRSGKQRSDIELAQLRAILREEGYELIDHGDTAVRVDRKDVPGEEVDENHD